MMGLGMEDEWDGRLWVRGVVDGEVVPACIVCGRGGGVEGSRRSLMGKQVSLLEGSKTKVDAGK